MESLASLVARDGPLTVHAAVGWTARLAMTLEALHREGAAHGMVTPSNIWVSVGDIDESIGILVHPLDAVRDAGFERPERVAGSPSPLDDTWAVAAVLYFLLTGVVPFKANMAGRWHAPTPIAMYGANHEVLQITCDRAWSEHGADRTADVHELRSSLAALDPGSVHLEPLQLAMPGAVPGTAPAGAQRVAAVVPAAPPRALLWGLGIAIVVLLGAILQLLR